jgi:hypothetical protein
MKHGTYIGAPTGWNIEAGMKALIQDHPTNSKLLLAQFDDHHAARGGKDLSQGWHEFPIADFRLDPQEKTA